MYFYRILIVALAVCGFIHAEDALESEIDGVETNETTTESELNDTAVDTETDETDKSGGGDIGDMFDIMGMLKGMEGIPPEWLTEFEAAMGGKDKLSLDDITKVLR